MTLNMSKSKKKEENFFLFFVERNFEKNGALSPLDGNEIRQDPNTGYIIQYFLQVIYRKHMNNSKVLNFRLCPQLL